MAPTGIRLPANLADNIRFSVRPSRKFINLRERIENDQGFRTEFLDAVITAAVEKINDFGFDITVEELRQ